MQLPFPETMHCIVDIYQSTIKGAWLTNDDLRYYSIPFQAFLLKILLNFCKIKGTVRWCGLGGGIHYTDLIHTCIILLYIIYI